jgi:hypothetical protein
MRHSDEAKKRISDAMRKLRAAESIEQKKRRNPGRPMSEATKQKLRIKALGRKHSTMARKAISEGKRGKTHKSLPPEAIERIRQKATGRRHTPEAIAKMIGHPAYHRRGKCPEYAGIRMRSTYETRTAKALDALGIKWLYEPRKFWFDQFTYTPDFFLVDEGVYWEVKGWYHDRAKLKVETFRATHPDIPLVVMSLPCIESLESAAKSL